MDESLQQANKQLAQKLVLAAIAAGAFGFALAPFYDVLCRVTGLNGKTGGAVPAQAAQAEKVDLSRRVTVEFSGNAMPGLSWEFSPRQHELQMHPGEIVTTTFFARNPTNQTIYGQAIPSVSPGWAAQYFKKIDCFCYKPQQLKPGESREMALTFFISSELPQEVRELALSYSFFPLGSGT